MFAFLSTARDLGRMHEIARVLIRHGLGDLVRLGVDDGGLLDGHELHRALETMQMEQDLIRFVEVHRRLNLAAELNALLAERTQTDS